eukprot:TRINITY_DN4133_c0_g1_i1.p1 TRINITY_DN4133_c0_g1~~TRINITY_DN4133_c0_g1_i1.p1  ORF type:complete len:908 (+),score=128.78 TRINITY_DN4133_c0_g1_i1:332-3055(+)
MSEAMTLNGKNAGVDGADMDTAAVRFFRSRLDFAHTLNSLISAVGTAKPQDHVAFMIEFLQKHGDHSGGSPRTKAAIQQETARETPRTKAAIQQQDTPRTGGTSPRPKPTALQEEAVSGGDAEWAPGKVRIATTPATVHDAPWRTAEMTLQMEEHARIRGRPSFFGVQPMPAMTSPQAGTPDETSSASGFRVGTSTPLRRLRSKSKLALSLRIGQEATCPAGMPMCDLRALKSLIPKGTVGIVSGTAAEKAEFIAHRWMPFVKRATALRDLARERAQSELNIVDRIPIDNFEIHDMLCECMHLTGQWYGHGKANISFMYEWFMSTCEAAGISKYSFDQIRTQWSRDKYCLLVDSTRRGQILSRVRELNELERQAGEWTQQQGVSAIDNTLLNNIFTPEEATQLLSSEICHRFIVLLLHHAQLRALRIIGRETGIDLRSEADPDVIKGVLDKMDDRQLAKWGIVASNVSYVALRRTGKCVWNWGQLPPEYRVTMHKWITNSIARRTRKLAHNDPFLEFVSHAKKKPGEYFKGCRKQHLTMLFIGIIARKVVVVTRSEMERHTKAKYLAIQWRRKCDLKDASQKTVRPASTIEHMRLRINEAGYAPSHGMSLGGSGVVEDADTNFEKIRHSRGRRGVGATTVDGKFEVMLAREMNLPRDPGARLANWYLIDVEKILHEVRLLNPPGFFHSDQLLPGEVFHEVGQNPKIGSSIAATQHTQISSASLSTWPIYQLEEKPKYVDKLRATLDVVQVGWDRDASYLKVKTQEPTYFELVQFLCDLKSHMTNVCPGGATGVDFNVKAMLDDIDGGFVVIFTPIVQLDKGPDGSVDAGLTNPDTQETEAGRLPVCKIDTGKGCGLFMISAEKDHDKWRYGCENGEESLRALYDFCRKPGARDVMLAYIKDRIGVTF